MFGLKTPTTLVSPTDHGSLVTEQHEDERTFNAEADALRASIAVHDRRIATLKAQLDEEATHRATLAQKLGHVSNGFERRRATREQRLRSAADPRIDAFITWLDRELGQLSHKIVTRIGRTPPDLKTGRRDEYQSSNLGAVQVVARAIHSARADAERLKFLTVADIPQALDAIRRTIPSVDEAEVQAP